MYVIVNSVSQYKAAVHIFLSSLTEFYIVLSQLRPLYL